MKLLSAMILLGAGSFLVLALPTSHSEVTHSIEENIAYPEAYNEKRAERPQARSVSVEAEVAYPEAYPESK
ncbi:hypothetical protein ASPACDRAFT_42043 [Aspergillus aculeatus ATCC 16872]|uniref:Uncharacterized protein n=1 Tax=Aspergillus aculeatus (strain ATCC 16872 / CBS 172.66 / WB 5094) TaxID=690307 RepID=A0A1L9X0G7_ASPA1|nr:uncharacterized protein ASPACDRAFT_42043 [Aspergillus aculeatus ATCC 16872]OJK01779.1 hypothetical protein ASPACDRAFT_42043 [Aspergillus aculeatus ATCC 16872]